MAAMMFRRVATRGQRTMATQAAATRLPTILGMKGLASEYSKTLIGGGGLFAAGCMVSPLAAVCVGSMFATAHVVDMVANDDLDDITTLPIWAWNRMCGPRNDRKRVVILGSGWGALAFARKLDPMLYDVTIISERSYFFYTPLLAGVTTGSVKAHSIVEPIRQTHPMPHATYINAECTGVDPEKKTLQCNNQGMDLDMHYDHLVVACGAQPNTFGIPGVQEHAFFLKELRHGLAVRKQILNRLEQAMIAHLAGRDEEVRKLLSITIVGGGPTGVELAAELVDYIESELKVSFPKVADRLKITLVEAMPAVLSMFDRSISEHVKQHLVNLGVEVCTETAVKSVDSNSITMQTKSGDTSTLDYGVLVWVAGVGARTITKTLAGAFGQSNNRGIEVDEFLRVKGARQNEVFAFGDCAVSGFPLTAQVAQQQGKYLGRVFRKNHAGNASPFCYNHQGTMAYVGSSQAVAVLQPPAVSSSFWRYLSSCPDNWLKPEHRMSGGNIEPQKSVLNVLGVRGFAVWRAVYYVKLFSYANRFNVASDWIRNLFFGRVVASSMQQ
jgi:NADH:ubiquinone reductase (non-electrogenic)